MGQILRNWRALIAVVFSIVLIGGSFILARGIESPPVAQASTESALLQSIAAKDSDGDGLSDWEEMLYGTDPHIVDTGKLGMSDGVAVARGLYVPKAIIDLPVPASVHNSTDENGLPPSKDGTLTDSFVGQFASLYFAAREANGNKDLSDAELEIIAEQSINSLSSLVAVASDYKNAADITTLGSGTDSFIEFAIHIEQLLLLNKANAKKSEVAYLKDAVEQNDMSAIPHIASLAKMYRDVAVGIAQISVPKDLVPEDVALINSMMRISQLTSDFASLNDDPLSTIIALEQYPDAVNALASAYTNVGKRYAEAGIVLEAGTPGAAFVNLIHNLANGNAQPGKKP